MKSKFLVLGAALSIMGAAVLASPAFAGVAGSGHNSCPGWGVGTGNSGVEGGGHAGILGGGHSSIPGWGVGTGNSGIEGGGHNAVPKCLELGCGGN